MTAPVAGRTAAAPQVAHGAVANLFSGSFALVMATGIVSIAAEQRGYHGLAVALLWVNVGAYVVLWALTLVRIIRFPSRVVADLTSHKRGAAFLTIVAGTEVLGSQFALLTTRISVAVALWWFGLALWTLLLYAFLTAVTFADAKPSLDEGIGGVWLLRWFPPSRSRCSAPPSRTRSTRGWSCSSPCSRSSSARCCTSW